MPPLAAMALAGAIDYTQIDECLMSNRRIIISGGGTGGHIFPAIAIANALQTLDPNIEIRFVGALGKMEMERVPAAGYPIEGLWISGFQRRLTFQNALFPLKLLSSLLKARRILKQFKPHVAVGVGGYASGPTLEMATRLGIPTLIQEQNSYAGVTNRLLANKVDRVCVAYDNMERFFPKEKIVFTGNPIRQNITDIAGKREEALQHFGLSPDKKTVVIVGGSLGARTLNNAMEDSFDPIANHQDVQFLWQAGKLYHEEFAQKQVSQLPNVHLVQFIDRMDLAYAAADVILSRAGAATISELSLVKKPAILVPSPNVAEDHQTKNAQALVDKDAALLLPDARASADMVPMALELLQDASRCAALSHNVGQLGQLDAAMHIAAEVLAIIKK